MIGFCDPYQFTIVPAGIIVPYFPPSTFPYVPAVAPAGWTLFTAANAGVGGFSGCYIRAAGGTVGVNSTAIGGSPAGHVQFLSTEQPAHTYTNNAQKIKTCYQPGVPGGVNPPRRRTGGSPGGNHTHLIDTQPIIGYNQYQFIKSTAQAEKFPLGSILLNTVHSNIPWLTQTATDGKYLRAGNRYSSDVTGNVTTITTSGEHYHAWDTHYPPIVGDMSVQAKYPSMPAGPAVDGEAGNHLHDINNITLTDYIKKVYTTAWSSASAFYGFRGMLAFYDGPPPPDANFPEGWAICDGTNGTIDMREHFIYMTTTATMKFKQDHGKSTEGTNIIDVKATTGNMLASNDFTNLLGGVGHRHYTIGGEWVDSSNPYIMTYHETILIPHDHALTQALSKSYYPQCYGLYVIQKL